MDEDFDSDAEAFAFGFCFIALMGLAAGVIVLLMWAIAS